MFFWLIKTCMWLLKVFHPIFSFVLHAALLALWAYGIHIQTAPDTIDPAHQNKGVPWYITKNCNIVESKTDRAYCVQAKSSFAVSCIMLYVPPYLPTYIPPNQLYSNTVIQLNLRPNPPPLPRLPRPHPRRPPSPRRQTRRTRRRKGKMGTLPHRRRQRNVPRAAMAAHVGVTAIAPHTRHSRRTQIPDDAAHTHVRGTRGRWWRWVS
jgi:hypothetical protein